jgi:hypothetical protein
VTLVRHRNVFDGSCEQVGQPERAIIRVRAKEGIDALYQPCGVRGTGQEVLISKSRRAVDDPGRGSCAAGDVFIDLSAGLADFVDNV